MSSSSETQCLHVRLTSTHSLVVKDIDHTHPVVGSTASLAGAADISRQSAEQILHVKFTDGEYYTEALPATANFTLLSHAVPGKRRLKNLNGRPCLCMDSSNQMINVCSAFTSIDYNIGMRSSVIFFQPVAAVAYQVVVCSLSMSAYNTHLHRQCASPACWSMVKTPTERATRGPEAPLSIVASPTVIRCKKNLQIRVPSFLLGILIWAAQTQLYER